jgi:hypothetical protein
MQAPHSSQTATHTTANVVAALVTPAKPRSSILQYLVEPSWRFFFQD